jgi:two-component system, cell cycle sensor histidine kinase and response regulator CckA
MGTILVADDEKMLRRVISRVLSRAGYDVLLAENGQEAVSVFVENRERVSLVILDMNMPKLNGVGAARQIFDISPSTPVLIASGDDEKTVLAHFVDRKPDGLIQKPFIAATLVEAVEKHL